MSTPSDPQSDAAGVRILHVADVVGRPGRKAVSGLLPGLRDELDVDFCCVNCENAAGGAGVTRPMADALFAAGADVLTSGNHVWGNRDVYSFIDDEPRLIRPANFAPDAPGRGATLLETRQGHPILVANAMGRVFMNPVDCPFLAVDRILDGHQGVRLRLVDFHAEATSEKVAMSWYLDGRATAVVGTHTHVPTADARILPNGTAAITDVGMTGPFRSVIGVKVDAVLRRMVRGLPTRFETASEDVRLCGVLVEADPRTGTALAITRVERRLEEP